MSRVCLDCHVVINDEPYQDYMVWDDVWAQSGLGPDDGCLCFRCLETRIGYELTAEHFTHCILNCYMVHEVERYDPELYLRIEYRPQAPWSHPVALAEAWA